MPLATSSWFDPQAIKPREPAVVVILMLVTFGLYGLYWLYRTSDELHRATRDPAIRPGIDLLLTLLTCGLWTIYVMYRNAQRAHALLWQFDPYRRDPSQTVLILSVISYFVGFTGLVAAFLTQQELNTLGRAAPPL
jgi:hypothetical protein